MLQSTDPSDILAMATEVRALSERAAHIQAEVAYHKGRALVAYEGLRGSYQDAYDAEVDSYAKLHPDLSWEERASIYRVRLLNRGLIVRRAQLRMERIKASAEAIEVLTRAAGWRRGEVDTILRAQELVARFHPSDLA